MALSCLHCGSTNTQVHADTYACMNCGKVSTFKGEAIANEDLQEPRYIDDVAPDTTYTPEGSPAGSSRTPDGVWDHGTKLVEEALNHSGPVQEVDTGYIEKGLPVGTVEGAAEDADAFPEEREATEGEQHYDRMNTTQSSDLSGKRAKKK
jgi:hypothetical protein